MSKDTSSITSKYSLEKVYALIQDRIPANRARIYEAGGGSVSWLPSTILSGADVTVVDIDEGQLQRNKYAATKILGDIQTHAFPEGSFELVVCYNVIEHLNAPDDAIRQFFHALVPGGLVFIGAPNPDSFSGWMTKMTPHWFHVLFYRHVLGYKHAGQPGTAPFPTIFHPIVSPLELVNFCRDLGFNVLYFREYRGLMYDLLEEQRPVLGKLLNLTLKMANALVLWRKDLQNGNYHIVLEKPLGIKGAVD
jgi:2-polyprenyl-3-methyl-5-hydroxy-6-metoxy-1,4-benzoquinol methylase